MRLLLSVVLSILVITSTFAAEIEVVTEYFQNYQLKGADGELDGFAVEAVKAMFKHTQHTANIKAMPWGRAYKIATQDKNVMIFSITRTPKRLENFHFIGILTSSPLLVWGLKSKFPQKVTDYQQLRPYYFVSIRDTNPDNILTKLGFGNIYRVSTQQQLLGMIFKERADLFISGHQPTLVRTKNMGLDFDKLTPVYQFKKINADLGIAFSKNTDPELIAEFKRAFQSILDNGELKQIKQKWDIPH